MYVTKGLANKTFSVSTFPGLSLLESSQPSGCHLRCRRIKNLTSNSLKVKPVINQVELNYWNPQPELLAWSKENDILLEAYSPLGSAEQVKKTLELPVVSPLRCEVATLC